MRPFTEPPPPATTPADDIARELERITDQLAVAAERGFDHSIRVDFDDEGVQKLVLMVNFLLATIQGTMRKLEEKNHQLQAEQESLKILLHQQEALLNNIPDMAWLKDLNSRYIAVNAPLADACRQTPQALVGKTDRDVWNPELAEKYMAIGGRRRL
jgi:PAS domain-containing protein